MNITTIILIIYVAGVIINALGAASIWDDLSDEGKLVKVRMAVIVFFVLASFATWIYMLVFSLAKIVISIFAKAKDTDGGENDN